ncbi:MAG TPA: M50 family metallopeptidase [Trebonia sp.]
MRPVHLPLSAGESALIGLLVAVVVLVPLLGLPAAHFSGMAREGAHALLALILGLTVAEIVLDRHSGSRTSIVGEGLRVVLVFLIGYLGPSLFGLGAALLISLGYAVAVLWLLVVLLVVVLFLLRGSFGLISVPFALLLLYWILRYAHVGTEVVAAYVVAWLLLLSGVRTVIAHGIHSGATDNLRGHTHLPYSHGLWWLLWLAGAVIALLLGGKLLVLG